MPIRSLLGLTLGALLMIVLLRYVSIEQFVGVARRGHVGWIAVCCAAGLLATVFRVVRFGLFFGSSRHCVPMYGVFATTRLLNYLLPFRTGELALLALLKQYKLAPTIAETTPVWLLLRLSDVGALATLSVIGFGVFAFDVGLARAGWLLMAVFGGCAVAFLAVAAWVTQRRTTPGSWWRGRLSSFRQGFRHLHDKRKVLTSFVLALLIWMLVASTATFVQIAFDTPLSLDRCLLVALSVLAVSVLPIHGPLGLGTDDASWAGLMILAGVGTSEAVALALCARIVLTGILLLDATLGLVILWSRRVEDDQRGIVERLDQRVSP